MPPVRRQRPKACDSCYQRKIRCDTRTACCRNCEIYGVECQTTRGDGSILRRPCSQSSLGEETPSSHPVYAEPQTYRSTTPSNGTTHPRFLPSPERPATPLVTSPTVFGLSNRSLQGVVTIGKGSLTRRHKYAGKMSTQVLCKSAEELFQDNEIRIRVMDFFRPYMNFAEEIPMLPSTYYPMVDKGTADRYLTAYLTSVNSLFPVVSPPVLTASFNSFYDTGSSNDPVLVCTIYTVLALGSRQDDAQDEAQRLFGAAWELYGRVVSTPYLPSVQALLLMALELMNSHKDGQAMLAVGTAVRIAQSIGMHRRLSSHTQPRERRFIAQEYSLRTRIWWVCYCLDKKLSFDTGRPSAINDIECDVDTPAEMAMLLHSGTTSDQDEFLKGLVQLCQIQSAVVSRLFCRTDHEAEYPHLVHEIEALDGQLLAWKAALPRSLQLDEQISVAHSDLVLVKPSFLHCIYYNTMLVIHRAALFGEIPLQPHQRAQPRMVAADAVCLNSARSLGRLVNEMLIAPSSWPVSRWMTPLVMNVIFTLYVGVMRNPAQWTSESDVALINSLRVCFSKINKVPFVIASFDELCSSLTRAIAVMKRRSQLMAETAPGSQPGSDLPVDGVLQDPVGDVNPDIDFRFGDFFGVYGGPDPLISMQMWPVNLDEAIDS